MQFIDSHCHLDMCDLDPYAGSMDDLVASAHAAGVSHMLTIGVDLENAQRVIDIAHKYPNVYASVGVHPHDAGNDPSLESSLRSFAADSKVVAIGETGLDYYYNDEKSHATQQESFAKHIEVAQDLDLPLIIHTRAAQDDTLSIMRNANAEYGVMHCFTESWEMAQAALDMGFYVSISGIVTFKNSGNVAEIASKVPLDRLLIETDSPYLAPVPYRGKKNEPKYVSEVAKFIADLRQMSVAELAKLTSDNFSKLFKVSI
jgi:TatD DNase family protein